MPPVPISKTDLALPVLDHADVAKGNDEADQGVAELAEVSSEDDEGSTPEKVGEEWELCLMSFKVCYHIDEYIYVGEK